MLIMFHFFLHDVVERIFPNEELVQTPYLDAEVLFYPKIVCVYLPWRQAECRNQNQYNRCIWMLVKSGKRRRSSGDTEGRRIYGGGGRWGCRGRATGYKGGPTSIQGSKTWSNKGQKYLNDWLAHSLKGNSSCKLRMRIPSLIFKAQEIKDRVFKFSEHFYGSP